jgi:AcrR family transcriptional regulator
MSISRQGVDRAPAPGTAREQDAEREAAGGARPADPRANQRERTRTAIVDAARTLLLAGKLPSVADAAEEARVSRATAYRYFPTQGALIQEAVTAGLVPVGEWEARLAGAEDLPDRVERLAAKMFELMRDNEALLRGYLLLSLQQWAKAQAGQELDEPPIRRGGRLDGIHAALAPFRGQLDPAALRRLAIAISMFMGVEARIVMRDIWDLDEDEAERVTRWVTRTLARAAAEEGKPSSLPRR